MYYSCFKIFNKYVYKDYIYLTETKSNRVHLQDNTFLTQLFQCNYLHRLISLERIRLHQSTHWWTGHSLHTVHPDSLLWDSEDNPVVPQKPQHEDGVEKWNGDN